MLLLLFWLVMMTVQLYDAQVLLGIWGNVMPAGARRFYQAATLLDIALLLLLTPWGGWLALVVGVMALIHLVFHLIGQRRLLRRLQPAPPEVALQVLGLADRWQVRPIVRVMIDPADEMGPAVMGLLRQTLVLPALSCELSEPELTAILAHELAHVQGRDPLRGWLLTIYRSLLGWHPLVRTAVRNLDLEMELAADQRAVAWLGDLDGYALALGRWGLLWAGREQPAGATGLAASRAPLLLRLQALTEPKVCAPHLELPRLVERLSQGAWSAPRPVSPPILRLMGLFALLGYPTIFALVAHWL